MSLSPQEQDYWDGYVRTLAEPLSEPAVRAGMAGNLAIADSLLALYLAGTKTAGSGLVRDYEHAGDPLPRPGEYWIVLDSSKQPKCIVKTLRVEFFTFADVPEHVAIAEGEGDLSIAYWTQAHESFFTPFLAEWGVTDLSREQVVTEFFALVYR